MAAQEFEDLVGDEIRPLIKSIPGSLPAMVDQAEQALLSSEEPLYQRADSIVRVIPRDAMALLYFSSSVPGSLGIIRCEQPYLVETLTRIARWVRYDKRKDKQVLIDCPEKVAATYLARRRWRLRTLMAVVTCPTLRPDGSVLQDAGYDERTGILFEPLGSDFPVIANTPTRSDAEAALSELIDALGTFPFVAEVDRSVALALLLTAVVRRSQSAAPLGAITAPTPRSGKTKLADCIATLGTGMPAPAMNYPDKDEEAIKIALSILMAGDLVVLIDNIDRQLSGDWLCSILTSRVWSARALGRNDMISVPTATLFLCTGNALVITGDLRTRTLLCRLDPKCERPEERNFEQDAVQLFSEHRARLVAAALTLMRAYAVSGESIDIPPWGGFEEWSRMVREPLVWLGQKDPCASLRFLEQEDPLRNELLALMDAWSEAFNNGEAKTARQLCEHADPDKDPTARGDLYAAIAAVAAEKGKLNPKRFGIWLGKQAGRIVDGRKILRAGEKNHVAQWKVETNGTVPF